ncbi:hypothetical protein [Cupriavidus sp. DL-D2]|uniref:hypothetical protein n=1 Tax=Cupriavidus sp. DL-D2 TaxID=3144974 RepID=UPI003214363F
MNLQLVKIVRPDTSSDFVRVTLADTPEQSDDPEHLYNHVEFEVFVRHANLMSLSLAQIEESAIAQAELVMDRVNAD